MTRTPELDGGFDLDPDEFVAAIVNPRGVLEQKIAQAAVQRGAGGPAFRATMEAADWDPVRRAESALMSNPYTIHQAMEFMEAAPLMKIYALADGEVVIRREAAERFAERERLYEPDFDMDNLAVWDRVLSAQEVMSSYSRHFGPGDAVVAESLTRPIRWPPPWSCSRTNVTSVPPGRALSSSKTAA